MVVVCLKLGSFCVFVCLLELVYMMSKWNGMLRMSGSYNEWMNVNKIVYNLNFFGGFLEDPSEPFPLLHTLYKFHVFFKTNLMNFHNYKNLLKT